MSILGFILLFTTTSFSGDLPESDKLKTDLYNSLQASHKYLTYAQANEILFTKLDASKGSVCSVYSPDICASSDKIPDTKVMNIEHTWLQSQGAIGNAKSDLHNLFPSDSPTNSMRSDLPFCDVMQVRWTNNASKRGMSKFNEHCFEPPKDHKGNVARAIFYFSVRYRKPLDANQEYFLRLWNAADPVDQNEIDRNRAIAEFQKITNPFIDRPELVNQIGKF